MFLVMKKSNGQTGYPMNTMILSIRDIIKTGLLALLIGFTSHTWAATPTIVSDNFDDNSKNTSVWGTDVDVTGSGGSLTERSQRLEYTSAANLDVVRMRPWLGQAPAYDQDWEITLDVANTRSFASPSDGVSIGLAVQHPTDPTLDVAVEIYAYNGGSGGMKGFLTSMHQNGDEAGAYDTPNLNASSGKVRLNFDSAAKVIRAYYKTTANWVQIGSYGISGAGGGATANVNWGLTGSAGFKVGIYGYSSLVTVAQGEAYADNFQIAFNTQDSSGGTFPPTLTTQPQSQTVQLGQNAVFSADVGGLYLAYQWYKDGAILPGATNAVISLNGSYSNRGVYQLLARNSAGVITTDTALLKVIPSSSLTGAPSIIAQSGNLRAIAGRRTSLYVVAQGSSPLNYFWYRGNSLVASGSNMDTLEISPLQASDAGEYRVEVKNGNGEAASQIMKLEVAQAVVTGSGNTASSVSTQGFGLAVDAETGAVFVVESCTNLISAVWVEVARFTSVGSAFTFLDETAKQSQNKFYRVRELAEP
jgi:hypothetical protein